LHHVYQRVSIAHSTAITGDVIIDAGAFHSLLYQGHSVHDLCIASLIFDAVFHKPSIGFSTQYSAVLVASETVFSHVPIARGATQTVFHNLFQRFFRSIFEFKVYKFHIHNFNYFLKYVKFL